jgi:hypothetical protein
MRQDADRWALHSQSAWAVAGSRAGEQMSEPVAQERWRAAYRPDADERRSDLHTGDRWASVHADERGQEIRMGQRRASVHADEAGTRIQVEDRWAALRQEEPAATSWSELMPSWAEPGRSEAEPDQVRHRYAPGPADRAAPGGRARMPASERFDRGRR